MKPNLLGISVGEATKAFVHLLLELITLFCQHFLLLRQPLVLLIELFTDTYNSLTNICWTIFFYKRYFNNCGAPSKQGQ